uniref:tetratricopeptide repeat protein n=1 Tax=Rickettsia sp. MEAM1 (Bemisia tabaci) TaxID=1182263 RepID=UPI0012EEA659
MYENYPSDSNNDEEAYAGIYFNRGLRLAALGRHEEALELYNQAIQINPKSLTYFNKGLRLASLGRHEEALELYDQAIQINPHYAGTY